MNGEVSIDARMKLYELAEAGRMLMPKLPVMARIDGRCFSAFTRDFLRPYDESMSRCMVETTRFLVEETNAVIGYTQSDEISLCWYEPDCKSQMMFNGRVQKLVSILAAMATVEFSRQIEKQLWGFSPGCDEEEGFLCADHILDWGNRVNELQARRPMFDARVWNVPTLEEAANVFLWRNLDATKNAVSMAASAYVPESILHGKNGKQRQELLFQHKGINFNDYPWWFKRGTWIRRQRVKRPFTCAEIDKLPAKHAARSDPRLEVERWDFLELDLPPLARVLNKEDVLFAGAEPETAPGVSEDIGG